MDFYSNTRPRLFSNRLKQSIENINVTTKEVSGKYNDVINDNVSHVVFMLYDAFIKPNLLILILLCIIACGLYYRYIDKQNNTSEDNLVDELIELQNEEEEKQRYREYLMKQEYDNKQKQLELQDRQLKDQISYLQNKIYNNNFSNNAINGFENPTNAQDYNFDVNDMNFNYDDIMNDMTDIDMSRPMDIIPPYSTSI